MRIRIEKYEDRFERLNNWNPWFAWHPVCVNGGIVWLETVLRKAEPSWSDWYWIYKLPEELNK